MRKAIAVLVLIAGTLFAAPPTNAQVIVTDPGNIAVNVEQLLQHIQLIRRVEAQIRNQLLMLQNWEFTRLEAILSEMERVAEVLRQAQVYDNEHPSHRLDRVYPVDDEGVRQSASSDINAVRSMWMREQRQALVEARAVQNRAYESMPKTAERIAEYLEQSANSPGPTAATQAGNEMLGTLVGQFQTLQTLEITANREALEREAKRQAAEARARFHREQVIQDWPQ